MRVARRLAVCTGLLLCTVAVRADFTTEFADYNTISEIGVSGLMSSFYGDTNSGAQVEGALISSGLATFGPSPISYPYGVGQQPSPGGAVGRNFDQGALGFRVDGDDLVFKLATALDPQSAYYHSGFSTWYGQGDLFVNVQDSAGVSQFSLMSAWARDESSHPRQINRNYYDTARDFHVSGGAGGSSLEGHLVGLQYNNDVMVSGGTGAYTSGNAPTGLDRRVYAAGGVDIGDAGLTLGSFDDYNQTWYTQTWRISAASLSTDDDFSLSLHAAASCGNDQIGGNFDVMVPEPATLGLLTLGLLAYWRQQRR